MAGGNDSNKSAKRRRWFQFSLRWLLVLCLIVSLPLGYIGWRVHRGRRIHEVARQLHEHGYQLRGYGLPAFDLVATQKRSRRDANEEVARLKSEIQRIETNRRNGKAPEELPSLSQISCSFDGEPQPSPDDPLWLRGLGCCLFGETTFARPIELHEVDGRGDGDAIWRLIAELPELEELSINSQCEDLLRSPRAISTLRRLRNLKILRIEGRLDDRFLRDYQPAPSLSELTLSKTGGGSLEAWRQFFSNSRISSLRVRNLQSSKAILAAAKRLNALEQIYVSEMTLDDESLKLLFALEPTGGFSIINSRIAEGDNRALKRLAATGLFVDGLTFGGSDWKQFRQEHQDLLFGDIP